MFEKIDDAIANIKLEYEDDTLRKAFKAGDGFARVRKLKAALESRIASLRNYET